MLATLTVCLLTTLPVTKEQVWERLKQGNPVLVKAAISRYNDALKSKEFYVRKARSPGRKITERKNWDARIEEARKEIVEAKKYPPFIQLPLRVGNWGMYCTHVKVKQVLGPNMILMEDLGNRTDIYISAATDPYVPREAAVIEAELRRTFILKIDNAPAWRDTEQLWDCYIVTGTQTLKTFDGRQFDYNVIEKFDPIRFLMEN